MKTLWALLLLATTTWAFVAGESSNAVHESRSRTSHGAISARGFIPDFANVIGSASEVLGNFWQEMILSIMGGQKKRELRRELVDLQAEEERLVDLQAEKERLVDLQAKKKRLVDLQAEKERLVDLQAEKERLVALQAEKKRLVDLQAEKERLVDLQAEKERLVDLQAKEKQLLDINV